MLSAPVLVGAVGDVISLEAAKSFLRIDGDELNDEIALTAAAALGDLEDMTCVRLLHQVVDVRADSFRDLEVLRVGPVRSIASIKYLDREGVEQLLDDAAYELFGAPLEQGIRLNVGASWPDHRPVAGAIVVQLEVGYAADATGVPAKLRHAAFALLRGKFEGVAVDVEPLIVNHKIWL